MDDSWKDKPDLSAERDGVKVDLEWIGEGLCGDFNSNDEDDVPLLRFTVLKELDPGIWEEVEHGSYCTQLSAKLPQEELQKFCDAMLNQVFDAVKVGASIKNECERLSWMHESWFRNGLPQNSFTLTRDPELYSYLVIAGIKIHTKTGEVTIPEGMEISEAARLFWEAIPKMVGK